MNDRFEFGKNWRSFLARLDAERIDAAEASLCRLLGVRSLAGKRFLDLGCGSGLFSLAAHRLGAEVVSLDFDPASVACAEALKQRFASTEAGWLIRQGSILDPALMESLGEADVVYAWGVLHHTGDLHRAIELAAARTRPTGWLCLAIYNDQGSASRRWLAIKRAYQRLPAPLKPLWVGVIAGGYELKFAAVRLIRCRNPLPCGDWRKKRTDRGMAVWHDWVDWIGGLPFQTATPAAVQQQLAVHGFTLVKYESVGQGWGCNEFVFRKTT